MFPDRRWSRRTLLSSAATGLIAVAGCSNTDTDGSTDRTPSPSSSATTSEEPADRTRTPSQPTRDTATTESTTTVEEPTAAESTTTTVPVERETDVAFRETPERTLRLDLYRPETAESSPFVVYVHGGGWIGGDKGHRAMFDRLIQEGFAVADVQYRLAHEKQYPAAVRDVVAAVKWLQANAEEYDIDGERGALMGYSAGAHLAALVALAPDHEAFQPTDFHSDVPVAVDALVGYSGPYDFTGTMSGESPIVAAFFGINAPTERLREGSPVTHVENDAPPALLIHGTEDGIVPYASTTALADEYRDAGAPVEVLTGDGAGHGMIDDVAWREETLPTQEEFLATHLRSA